MSIGHNNSSSYRKEEKSLISVASRWPHDFSSPKDWISNRIWPQRMNCQILNWKSYELSITFSIAMEKGQLNSRHMIEAHFLSLWKLQS